MVVSNIPDFSIENEYKDCEFIAGIDEVGRGALCGSVFSSCAVIMNRDFLSKDIKDSKYLMENQREKIYKEIINNNNILYGIGESSVEEINKYNILQATRLSMERAFINLVKKYNIKPNLVLVDGKNIGLDLDTEVSYIIKKGKQKSTKSITIAVASIIAKVTRDRILKKMDIKYPMYDWKNNKGYGTEKHIRAIEKYGVCSYHRGEKLGKFACKKQTMLFSFTFFIFVFIFCL